MTHIITQFENYINEFISILMEQSDTRPVVIYSGRFQPFHAGHMSVYNSLVEKYGKDRVFIVSSDKTEPGKSPFSFNEKKLIMTKMFGINPNNIVQAKNVYAPVELLQNIDPSTPAIFAVSEKDSDRLKSGKYFAPYQGQTGPLQPYKERGYYDIVPEFEMQIGDQNISGTVIRQIFAGDNEPAKKALFNRIYGKFDEEIYSLMNNKISSPMTAPAAPTKSVTNVPVKSASQSPKLDYSKQKDKIEPLLSHKIRNPETNNDILVGTALKYDETHPAHRAATQYIKSRIHESILLEGGAAGHMQHPYEDLGLTFRDLKEIIQRSLVGGLDKEGRVSEKVDGQNLMVSMRDGKVIFARNKQHIKHYGEFGLTAEQLCQFFTGRGPIEDSFCAAAQDVEASLANLPQSEKVKLFSNGGKFMNMEIINPSTSNAIPYNKSVIMFHGTVEFDETGTPTGGGDINDGEVLASLLQDHNSQKQNTYELKGQNFIVFSDADSDKFSKKAQSYINDINSAAAAEKLSDDSTLGDFLSKKWIEFIKSTGPQLSPAEMESLVRRWATGDKSFGVKHMSPENKEWFRKVEATVKDMNEQFMMPIKLTVLKAGADSISRISNTLAANGSKSSQEMKEAIKTAIEFIKRSNDPNKLKVLEKNLDILNKIGMDKISSVEGLVFNYKNGIYKLTGAFAPFNQIYGRMKYAEDQMNDPSRRDTVEPTTTDAPVQEPEPTQRSPQTDILTRKIVNPVTRNNIQVRTALNYPEDHPAYKLARRMIDKN